jgi:beta-galactosidase/beta-glucuronidase
MKLESMTDGHDVLVVMNTSQVIRILQQLCGRSHQLLIVTLDSYSEVPSYPSIHRDFSQSLQSNIYLLKLTSVAFSPQANYTDRATASCWRS